MAVRGYGGPLGFPALAVMVNANLPNDANVGFWNGVASASTAVGRAFSPLVVGALWAATLRDDWRDQWPLDGHLAFYGLTLCGGVCLALSSCLGR